MGRRDLPDLYAQSPRAEGIHIRQILTAHVTSDMYHLQHSKNPAQTKLKPTITLICCTYIKNARLPKLVDQNMVCGSNTDQRNIFPG